jgi:putative transposase
VVAPEQAEQCVVYILKTFEKATYARACRIVGCSRKNKYYEKIMPIKDQTVKEAIKEVIGVSRKGRTKVIKLVQKRHPHLSASKIRRVYEQEGFALSKRLRRRIKDNPSNPIPVCFAPNEEWAMDFMSDTLSNGRKFRTLNVVDHYNRACLGIKAAHCLPARAVIETLEIMKEKHGCPTRIRTDNGPEFRSKLFQLWLKDNGIYWSRIQKGKPQQNAIIERFNRTFREDVLDANVFYTTDHAQEIADNWRYDYNHERPHQSLNYQTPLSYVA